MPYQLIVRHIDYDDIDVIKARNKDEVIAELLWILNRNGYYTEVADSDYS